MTNANTFTNLRRRFERVITIQEPNCDVIEFNTSQHPSVWLQDYHPWSPPHHHLQQNTNNTEIQNATTQQANNLLEKVRSDICILHCFTRPKSFFTNGWWLDFVELKVSFKLIERKIQIVLQRQIIQSSNQEVPKGNQAQQTFYCRKYLVRNCPWLFI